KKTSPHMVERVVRYKDKAPLFEASGVDAEIRSTLSRRVDLPSGGYLVFDYAEAFTVIDVNTGRFVGSRSKSSGARLEDTLTKKCPTCGGDGIVVSEATAAVEVERRLRVLAAGSKAKAFRVELSAKVASVLIGPGAGRLAQIEEQTKRRFLIEAKDDVHVDH